MTTWEEIRDEVAGMLADGKPLEDVISKLDEMNKAKPMTNEEWLHTLNTEQLAEILVYMAEDKSETKTVHKENVGKCVWWLKQTHKCSCL